MRKYLLVCWNIKSGTISKTVEGISSAMLKLWALQNTKSHQCSIIIDVEDERIVYEVWKNREFKTEDFYTNEDNVPMILNAVY